ncbi:uncharacterized protein LOC119465088 [Dermacentor silvarum]|uniref:uncharacterized protein LOC119465088 n=1 Tax=Dermacentor silvarum TaxID=543639 RepID=UPI0021010773|nr:uncharacterized protein LOC119465088 [Dermacentor silvarum]
MKLGAQNSVCSANIATILFYFVFSTEFVNIYSNGPLNLPMVLNTSEPLFLFLWSYKIRRPEEACKGYDCLKETGSCEQMRKIALDKYMYNFTVSKLRNQSEWDEQQRVGLFGNNTDPPVSMKVYNTTGGTGMYQNMTLIYNQEKTFNCSVFIVSEQDTQNAGATRCAMYVKGKLPNRVYPPLQCQIAFNTCGASKKVYKPYTWTCEVHME